MPRYKNDLRSEKKRLGIFVIILSAAFGILMTRFFYIQVLSFDYYKNLERNQSLRRINLFPERGTILDNKGLCFAVNINTNKLDLGGSFEKLNVFNKKYSRNRLYPMGVSAGQVLGFTGKDHYGLSGIEYEFDKYLYGQTGWQLVKQDAKKRKYRDLELPQKDPVKGSSIKLTIDYDIQQICEYCLKKGIDYTKAKAGVVIVMNPNSGDVLSMANYPFFDPNEPDINKSNDWKNKVISMTYEPGSTFKIVTACAALEEGVYVEEDIIKTGDGRFKIHNEYIHDAHNHGNVSFVEAVAYSSNVAFAKIALNVGSKRLFKYARNFGFGSKTNITLPGEESGILKPLDEWSGRTLVTMAIGHEILVTPLQIASAFCVVANGGVLYNPRIVKSLVKNNKIIEEFQPKPIRRVISPRTSKRIKNCLRKVVSLKDGTGRLVKIKGLDIAGKTGTTEKFDREKRVYRKDKFIASFAGFLPAENPELLCLVVLDEPQKVHSGGVAAAPIFKDIIKRIINSQNIKYGPKLLKNRELNLVEQKHKSKQNNKS